MTIRSTLAPRPFPLIIHLTLLLLTPVCLMGGSTDAEIEEQIQYHSFLQEINEPVGAELVYVALSPQTHEQVYPRFLRELLENFPECRAKIYCLDPTFPVQPEARHYLLFQTKNWQTAHPEAEALLPVRFLSERCEIVFYRCALPRIEEDASYEMLDGLFSLSARVLFQGGIFVAGHYAPHRQDGGLLVQVHNCHQDLVDFAPQNVVSVLDEEREVSWFHLEKMGKRGQRIGELEEVRFEVEQDENGRLQVRGLKRGVRKKGV